MNRSRNNLWPVAKFILILCCIIWSDRESYAQRKVTDLKHPAELPDLHDKGSYVDVEGARLFVRSMGSGEPLVIVHGGPGMSHDYLTPQMIDLLSSDYRLIFYDQRASGRSTGRDDTSRLTMSQFVRDLELLREKLSIGQLNLLGHSFGGLLAMYYAVSYPGKVSKLLLLDSSPASWEMNFPYFRKTIAERQSEEDRQELADIQQKAGFGSDPELMDRYFKTYFRTFFKDPSLRQSLHLGIDSNWLLNFNLTNDRVWRSLGKYDIHGRLPGITASTLVVHGDASVISIEGAQAIAERIPHSRLVILKDVGHFPYIEAPEQFRTVVKEFFRK
jgi:proline iminopeptidase